MQNPLGICFANKSWHWFSVCRCIPASLPPYPCLPKKTHRFDFRIVSCNTNPIYIYTVYRDRLWSLKKHVTTFLGTSLRGCCQLRVRKVTLLSIVRGLITLALSFLFFLVCFLQGFFQCISKISLSNLWGICLCSFGSNHTINTFGTSHFLGKAKSFVRFHKAGLLFWP